VAGAAKLFGEAAVVGTGFTIQVKKGDDVYTFDPNSSNFGGTAPTISKDAFVAYVRGVVG
jgi:hypothetical protein